MKYLILLSFLIHTLPAWGTPKLRLTTGQQKAFKAKATDSVWIEKSQVLSASEHSDAIHVKAISPGMSLLKIGEHSWQVEVVPYEASMGFRILQKKIKNMMGINAVLKGGGVQIQGDLLRLDDWIDLAQTGQKFQWQTGMDEELRRKAETYFNEKLKSQALPPGRLKLLPHPHIQFSTKDPIDQIAAVLSPYGLSAQTSDTQIELAPMVRVKISIAEVRREKLTRYGIKWPDAIKAGIQAGHSSVVITEDIEAVLNALSQEGKSQILASPALLCRSGKEAEFLAGGEIPIRVGGYKSSSVTWKKYGVLLKVKPLADRNGRMSIEITTEVSAMDPATTVDGMPGFLTNRVQTHFDLSSSQTIVLSGLIKHLDGQSQEGLPGLAKLPILGPLFSSREYRDQKTELVAFVTPEIIDEP